MVPDSIVQVPLRQETFEVAEFIILCYKIIVYDIEIAVSEDIKSKNLKNREPNRLIGELHSYKNDYRLYSLLPSNSNKYLKTRLKNKRIMVLFTLVKRFLFFQGSILLLCRTVENPNSKSAYIQGLDKEKKICVCEVIQQKSKNLKSRLSICLFSFLSFSLFADDVCVSCFSHH